MPEFEQGHLLRIYISESAKHQGMRLYHWILRKAREQGLAGGTVLRGMAGFCADSVIRTTKILRFSEKLPVVIEIVDDEKKILDFIPVIDSEIKEGLVTVEKVNAIFYGGKKE